MKIQEIQKIVNRLSANLFGLNFRFDVQYDKSFKNVGENGNILARIYLQCKYTTPCTDTGEVKEWGGRKWYLSEFMTEDEVVKTAWCSFEKAVQHEVMEAFKVDGIRLFNPHVNFEELLKVSNKEVRRA